MNFQRIKRIIKIILILFLATYYFTEYGITLNLKKKNFKTNVLEQEKLTKGNLLDSNQILQTQGYSFKPIIKVNQEIPAQSLTNKYLNFRTKRFDHFSFTSSTEIIHFSIITLKYICSLTFDIYDIKTNTLKEYKQDILYGLGEHPILPNDPISCQSYSFNKNNHSVRISRKQENKICYTTIEYQLLELEGRFDFEINMEEDHIYEIVKLNESGSQWFYGNKSMNLKVKQDKYTAATDYAVGVFPYKVGWKWGSANGWIGLKKFAFNFEQGLSDYNTSHPDYFKIDKKQVKLEPIDLKIYGKDHIDYIHFFTHSNFIGKNRQTDIKFKPFKQNLTGTDYMLLSGSAEYLYGLYEGYVTDENGDKTEFQDILGIYEVVKMKW